MLVTLISRHQITSRIYGNDGQAHLAKAVHDQPRDLVFGIMSTPHTRDELQTYANGMESSTRISHVDILSNTLCARSKQTLPLPESMCGVPCLYSTSDRPVAKFGTQPVPCFGFSLWTWWRREQQEEGREKEEEKGREREEEDDGKRRRRRCPPSARQNNTQKCLG